MSKCMGDYTTCPPVAVGDLSATGTPSSSTYLRGDNTWSSPAGAGTVTSVGLVDSTGLFTITGTPITSNGSLTLSAFASQSQSYVLAGPSGGSGAAAFRALVAGDIPTLNQSTTSSAASLSVSGQTGLMTIAGLTSTNRAKTVRDAADTILELGGSYTPTGTWTSMTLVTPTLGTPASGALTNCTFPTLNQNTTGTAFGLASGHAITNAQFPRGLFNCSTTTQGTGQLSASTPVYITNSSISLPASLVTGIVAGTVFRWRFNVGKNANGTGACSILLYYGTHGSTADTAYVTQALPASTAALDTMTVDVQVTFTSTTACSYVIGVTHSAATGAGFGVASGTPAYAGTATGMTTSTGSLIFGIGIQAATGGTLPTYTIGFVQGEAFNLV